jgi:hypothetical protein
MALIFGNATSEPVWVAYMFWSPDHCRAEGGDWQAIGWFLVPPMGPPWHPGPGRGKKGDLPPTPITTTVYGNSLRDVSNRYWCFYAQNDSGSMVWAGPYSTYVSNDAFNHCYREGRTDWYTVGFRLVDVGDADSAVVTLTE